MNGKMLKHPATQANIETLRTRGYKFVEPKHGNVSLWLRGPGKTCGC